MKKAKREKEKKLNNFMVHEVTKPKKNRKEFSYRGKKANWNKKRKTKRRRKF